MLRLIQNLAIVNAVDIQAIFQLLMRMELLNGDALNAVMMILQNLILHLEYVVNAFQFNTATFKTIEIQEKPKHFMHGDLEPS